MLRGCSNPQEWKKRASFLGRQKSQFGCINPAILVEECRHLDEKANPSVFFFTAVFHGENDAMKLTREKVELTTKREKRRNKSHAQWFLMGLLKRI